MKKLSRGPGGARKRERRLQELKSLAAPLCQAVILSGAHERDRHFFVPTGGDFKSYCWGIFNVLANYARILFSTFF